jgi:hypothetical protein
MYASNDFNNLPASNEETLGQQLLTYTYEEVDDPEAFFIPFAWTSHVSYFYLKF